jgi:hypothetical protein
MKITRLSEFIGDDLVKNIEQESIWLTQLRLDQNLCNVYDFDASFFDGENRVEKKYKTIAGFDAFDKMSLEELDNIVNPPIDGSRTIILGTTEYLLPYVAYCLKFIDHNKIDAESGNRATLPFIFFSLPVYTEVDNIKFIDCVSHYYETKKYIIRLVISKDKKNWLTLAGKPRVTIYEMMRLLKNLGDIEVTIDDSDTNVYKVTFENKSSGGRKNKRKTICKQSKRRKRKNKKNRTNKMAL